MPRLSLYKPERGQDFKFMDRQISEMFQAGGTDVYLHKYLGPKLAISGTADQPVYSSVQVTNIQDLLFLENRDRKYDSEIYKIRGIYNVANIDFNVSAFGLFLDNDTMFMTVHINDFIRFIGRKPISGDVFELPHLRDEFALNDYDISLPRYYVIEDVGRASEGFSATWYPHLYRLKCKKITDNQQFADILNTPTGANLDKFVGDYDPATAYYTGNIVRYNGVLYNVTANTTGNAPPNTSYFGIYSGTTLESVLSTRAKELEINDQVLAQAEADAPKSGYETRQFFTLAADANGNTVLKTADESELDASNVSNRASEVNARPARSGYNGYIVGDGFPLNGYDFGHGIQFPANPGVDDFFLRTDFLPSRLFRFDGNAWIKVEDAVRMTMTNNDTRQTLKTSFINNTAYMYNDDVAVDYVDVTAGDTVVNTTIDGAVTARYVLFKLYDPSEEMSYAVAEHNGLLSTYLDSSNVSKLKITLPVVNGVQQTLQYSGNWVVKLCNNREEQRQGLSKALRPKADL